MLFTNKAFERSQIMLSQPRLVKSDDSNKTINLKSQPKGSARFLLGLNNRVSHMEKRLTRLESTQDHILRHHIGYKELGLTFVLALLVFTSITLALKEFDKNPLQDLSSLNAATLAKLLSASTGANNSLLQDELNASHPQQNRMQLDLKWPLEKQPNIQSVEYSQHKHGIELSAKLGDPVIAIDDGKVLYSGDAINSYGNLILVQHDNDIISVYGNNYSNYVLEGNHVKKGQLIAAVGEGDGKQAKLYFEIRYKGKAQDPFLYFK